MSVTAIALIIGSVLPPVLTWAIYADKKRRASADKAWAEAAQALGGELTPVGGPWYKRTPRRIDAVVDGVAVAIDHYEESSGDSTVTHTRARSRASAPPEFTLKVHRSHALSGLGRVVGFQDIEVGDPGFDDAYVVKSSDPVAARIWLNGHVRKAIAAVPEFAFAIKEGALEGDHGKLLLESSELLALAHAMAACSDGRQRVMKVWQEVAKAYDGAAASHAERWATMEAVFDRVRMRFDTRKVGDEHYTYVTAAVRGGRAKPFVLARGASLHDGTLPRASAADLPEGYELWAHDADVVASRLGPAVRDSIAALSPAMIQVGEDDGTVTWQGVCVSREEMEEAMRLCHLVTSAEPLGPYR